MKHIEKFNNFRMNESDKYIPDHDNILQIMKDKYGYGDLSYGWMEEFEQTKDSKVSSDEEFAEKFDKFIKFIDQENLNISDNDDSGTESGFEGDWNKTKKLETVITIKGVGLNPSEIKVNIVKIGDYYEMIRLLGNNKNGETINLNPYEQEPTLEEIRFEVIGKYGNGKIDYSGYKW